MAKVKALILAHGEKLALAVVLVLALWSISSNLLVETVKLPGGERIETDSIQGNLKKIASRLSSSRAGEAPDVADTSAIVRQVLDAYTVDTWTPAAWEAPAYAKPAPPFSPKEYVPPTESLAPPPKYISRIDQPVDMRVYVGGERVVVLWKEGPRTQWRNGAKGALWRKVLGDGREDAPWEEVREKQLARYGESGRRRETEEGYPGGDMMPEERDPGNAYDLGAMGEGFREEPRRPAPRDAVAEADAADPDAEGDDTTAEMDEAGSAAAQAAAREREAIAAREAMLDEDRKLLLDPNTTLETRWKLLGRGLQGYRRQPDVDLLLEEGDLPAEERAEWEPVEGHDEEASGEQLWFYYVDEDLNENTVYRYKALVYAQPMDLPEAVRLTEEGTPKSGYEYYAPILRMGRARLALTEEMFVEQLRALDGEPSPLAPARPFRFRPLQRMDKVVYTSKGQTEAERERVVWYAFPYDTPKEQIAALSDKPQFGQFQWSDYVLTPVRTRIVYTGDAEDVVFVRVVLTDALGEQILQNFQVQTPAVPETAERAYFDPTDQMRARAVYPLDIQPAPIGEVKRVGTVEHDFRTGWGLVDTRDCTILVRRYKLEPKLDRRGERILDEAGNPVLEKTIVSEREWPHKYLVIRELEGKSGRPPRYKALLKFRRSPTTPDGGVEVVVADWNPGIARPDAANAPAEPRPEPTEE
ncbi:MAG: hypothetical protein ACOCX4_02650 [Planctomycetota bacterium]